MAVAIPVHKRYIINIPQVMGVHDGKVKAADVLVHDAWHPTDDCEEIKHPSRFGNLAWALGKGYSKCPVCMPAEKETT